LINLTSPVVFKVQPRLPEVYTLPEASTAQPAA
jgi:hypothetical protein